MHPGPSGCGKTTLLRVIDGLIRPDSGEVLIDGRPVTRPSPDAAMVFQQFHLFPWKQLEQNVAYGLKLRGKPRGEVEAAAAHHLQFMGHSGFEQCYR